MVEVLNQVMVLVHKRRVWPRRHWAAANPWIDKGSGYPWRRRLSREPAFAAKRASRYFVNPGPLLPNPAPGNLAEKSRPPGQDQKISHPKITRRLRDICGFQ